MLDMDIAITIITAITSGIIGTFAAIGYQHWAEYRRMRIDCLRRIQAYGNNDEEFHAALNEVPITFNSSAKVLGKYKMFVRLRKSGHDANSALIDLIKEMMDDLGIKRNSLDDEIITNRFSRT
ncbi:hypothetical protein ACW7BJ_31690 [Azospirillum argentinense]